MPEPRKHHYLPQFYLRGFSLDRRSLFQINKANSVFHGCQIKDIAAIRDFHEIDIDGIVDPNAIEKRLAAIESEQAVHLAEVFKSGIRHHILRGHIVQFLLMMRMRVPAVKEFINESYGESLKAETLLMERAGKLPKPPAGFEKVLGVDELKFEVMNWKCLEKMFMLASSKDHLEILWKMRATLYHAPFGSSFVTCDQPVAIYYPSAKKSAYGVGIATPFVEVTLPLSSRLLLKFDHRRGGDAERSASSDEVNEFNRRAMVMAEKYIFAAEGPERVAKFVTQHSHTFAGFQHETIDGGKEFLQMQRFVPVYQPEVA